MLMSSRTICDMTKLKIPDGPTTIEKGVPLKDIFNRKVVAQLGTNLQIVHKPFKKAAFVKDAMKGLEPLTLTQRSEHIAEAMRKHLPQNYSKAIQIILKSLTPPLEKTEGNGLATMFYMPHCHYISKYGLDDFKLSMDAQYELTQRFTCEFSIRPFIIQHQSKTMKVLYKWMKDKKPHVRRLCSEGTRPRLPWAMKIAALAEDPTPSLKILEQLKDDPDLYVRRSVANHVGDIAKDNLDLALELCESWLEGASEERKWVIRHALRHPAKKEIKKALKIRKAAK